MRENTNKQEVIEKITSKEKLFNLQSRFEKVMKSSPDEMDRLVKEELFSLLFSGNPESVFSYKDLLLDILTAMSDPQISNKVGNNRGEHTAGDLLLKLFYFFHFLGEDEDFLPYIHYLGLKNFPGNYEKNLFKVEHELNYYELKQGEEERRLFNKAHSLLKMCKLAFDDGMKLSILINNYLKHPHKTVRRATFILWMCNEGFAEEDDTLLPSKIKKYLRSVGWK